LNNKNAPCPLEDERRVPSAVPPRFAGKLPAHFPDHHQVVC